METRVHDQDRRNGNIVHVGRMISSAVVIGAFMFGGSMLLVPQATASHQGRHHVGEDQQETTGTGFRIPGAPFQVFDGIGKKAADDVLDQAQADEAVRTVVDAFTFMMQHRADYPRFDESLNKNALQKIVIEPRVVNQEGKAFPS